MRSGGAFKKRSLSNRRMQCIRLSVFLILLNHFATVFPKVFVSLDIQFNKVADFYRVNFASATVADLRKQKNNCFLNFYELLNFKIN